MTSILLVVHGTLALSALVASILGVQARTPERARQAATWLLATVGSQTVIGDVLYPAYLQPVKPVLQAMSAGGRSAADIFEVKEHLAFLALVTAIGAFVITRREARPTPFVRVLFGGAHAAIVLVATLGLVVASLRTP